MELTRRADYAIRAVIYMARLAEGERASTSEIASEQHIPLPFLAKIISQLAVAGVVDAMRGASGGVRLARSPDEISMLDVIEVIEGPLALNHCLCTSNGCSLKPTCPMYEVWADVQRRVVRRLKATTFDKLARRADELSRRRRS